MESLRPYFVPILSMLSLALFGLGFNAYVERQEKKGVEGETWIWVVIGVGITLAIGGFIIGWINVLWLIALFAASGLPMMIGAHNRHQKKLKRLDNRISENAEQTPPAG
jgi:hypothetical protein